MRYFIYGAIGFVGLIALGTLVSYIQAYLIRRNRKDDKRGDFIDHFVSEGISEPVALSVYKYLQNWMGFDDFPVRPQDNIVKIYGIVDEDMDELIIEIAEANNLVVPDEPDEEQEPIATVEDLIRFIASFSEKRPLWIK